MAAPAKLKRSASPEGRLAQELSDIKRLLVVLLIKSGTTQSELGAALGVNPGHLSRLLPARKFKPFNGKGVPNDRA
jgi:hypothetical protein